MSASDSELILLDSRPVLHMEQPTCLCALHTCSGAYWISPSWLDGDVLLVLIYVQLNMLGFFVLALCQFKMC